MEFVSTMQLIFATHNQHKLLEVSKLISPNIQLLSLSDIKYAQEIEETADTIEKNASLKAWHIYNYTGNNCFGDDSGLEIEALNMEPGVYSARYAGEHKSDSDNIKKVLHEMSSKTNRVAQFKTIISLVINGEEHIFEGIIKGSISEKATGTNGFGYDPIFIPKGYNTSFAEMSLEEKNKISHRSIAVGKLVNFLNHHYSL
jgi:XTP/dITP diphosphohydrolase